MLCTSHPNPLLLKGSSKDELSCVLCSNRALCAKPNCGSHLAWGHDVPTLSSMRQETKKEIARSCIPETPGGMPPSNHLCTARGCFYCLWHRRSALFLWTQATLAGFLLLHCSLCCLQLFIHLHTHHLLALVLWIWYFTEKKNGFWVKQCLVSNPGNVTLQSICIN